MPARVRPLTDEEREMMEEMRLRLHRSWERIRRLPPMSDGPRDVRRGDRWLPWHFRGRGRGGDAS